MIENESEKCIFLHFGDRDADPWQAERWAETVASSQADFREIEARREALANREAEIAAPYALFAFALPLLAIIAGLVGWAPR